MPGLRFRFVAPLLAALAAAAPLGAQTGVGAAGAQVLQLPAGARAAALSGAYTAAGGDADVLFYNPAGTATLDAGVSLSYQRHAVPDINFGSASGAYRLGPVVLSAGAVFLDAGTVDEIVPDPRFGGERGKSTGETASASESAARLALALPLLSGRLRLGAAAGFVSTNLAGLNRSAPAFDLGAQYSVLPSVTLGASVRNLGGELTGDDAQAAALPTEARAGAAVELASGAVGMLVSTDLVARLEEGTTGLVAGVEAGLLPGADRSLSAVARIGYDATATGDDTLAPLRLGAGLSLGSIAVDYAYQDMNFFGAVHRIGLRWTPGLR